MRSLRQNVHLFLTVLSVVAANVALTNVVAVGGSSGRVAVLEGCLNGQAAIGRAVAAQWTAQADVIKAAAEANTANAKVLQTLQQVRSLALDNNLKAAKTFYEKRKLYEASRALRNRKRPSREDLIRYSKNSAPKRPANYQLEPVRGTIYWPEILRHDEFLEHRLELDCLFARRKTTDGSPGSDVSRDVQQVAMQMRQQLQAMIRRLPPAEYLTARKFIDSLAFEAQFPPRIEGVAAN